MRRALIGACLAVAVTGCSSNSNASDPVTACKNFVSTVCNRVYVCFPSTPGTAASCTTTAEANCTTANTTCPQGQTFNSSNASQCITDVGNLSCTDIQNIYAGGNPPTSCENVCT
jgi:hypothetical protein